MLSAYAPGSAGDLPARAEFALTAANTTLGLLSQLASGPHPLSEGITPIESLGTDTASSAAKARLAELLNRNGSDKANLKKHNYHELYGYILREPASISAVLEIGLGTNNVDVVSNMSKFGRPGASLRAFRDFLPNAKIFGADVDERILFTEERIETHFVDQTDQTTLDDLARVLPDGFDLIIDDGLHSPEANLATLMFGLKKVKPGGWVVVEDVVPQALPVWKIAARLVPAEFQVHILQAKTSYVFAVRRLGTVQPR
jgi:SAM-dependent methyltransferase